MVFVAVERLVAVLPAELHARCGALASTVENLLGFEAATHHLSSVGVLAILEVAIVALNGSIHSVTPVHSALHKLHEAEATATGAVHMMEQYHVMCARQHNLAALDAKLGQCNLCRFHSFRYTPGDCLFDAVCCLHSQDGVHMTSLDLRRHSGHAFMAAVSIQDPTALDQVAALDRADSAQNMFQCMITPATTGGLACSWWCRMGWWIA